MDYEKDISIDEDALDVEWIEFPMKFFQYANELAGYDSRAKRAGEMVKSVHAELTLKIASSPEKFLKEVKPTVANVEACVQLHPDLISAKEKQSQAEYDKVQALNALQAMNGKKTALENLVKLHGQSYFAGPSVPRDLKSEIEKKNARLNVANKRQRNRRGTSNGKKA